MKRKTWNTYEMIKDFYVIALSAPYAVVTRKEDGKRGTLKFKNKPPSGFSLGGPSRIYYDFQEKR